MAWSTIEDASASCNTPEGPFFYSIGVLTDDFKALSSSASESELEAAGSGLVSPVSGIIGAKGTSGSFCLMESLL